MSLQRSQRDWSILINEYNICKKKLESKREALKILMSDLESCQRERDIHKNKIRQLQLELDGYKLKESSARQTASTSPERTANNSRNKRERSYSCNVWEQELQNIRDKKNKTLSQLLCEAKDENKAYQKDLNELRLLYKEAQEDILLLREKLARHSQPVDKSPEGNQEFLARQDLISQLEQSQEQVSELDRELQSLNDEKSELATERDHFRDKAERLNKQLNFILGADDRRLVDIDAVLMENRYLKEQIKQLKEEKGMASESLARYRAICERRKNKIMRAGQPNSYTSLAKQALPSLFSELTNSLASGVSPATVSELQFLVNSLSENLTEKDTALTHQRRANKILGSRVAELEKKLKTLEVSGLWSLQGHRGYGSSEAETMHKDQFLLGGCVGATKDQSQVTTNGRVENNNEPEEQAGRQSAPDSPAVDWHEGLSSPEAELEHAMLDELIDSAELLVNVDGVNTDSGDVDRQYEECSDTEARLEGPDGTEPTPDGTHLPFPQTLDEHNERSEVTSPPSESVDESSLQITSHVDSPSGRDSPSAAENEGGLDTNLAREDEQCNITSEEDGCGAECRL